MGKWERKWENEFVRLPKKRSKVTGESRKKYITRNVESREVGKVEVKKGLQRGLTRKEVKKELSGKQGFPQLWACSLHACSLGLMGNTTKSLQASSWSP